MGETVCDPGPPNVTTTDQRARGYRGRWVAALVAGVIATGLTWAAGEVSVDRFPQKKVIDPMTESADLAGFHRVLVKNATLACGLQGALLGLTLGVAGVVASGASKRSAAGAIGLVIGGVLGAVGSFGLFTAYFALVDANAQDMTPSILTHGGVAAMIGAAGGLAFGVGLGGRQLAVRGMVGGLIGAALGATLVEVLVAVIFPHERIGSPIASAWESRLITHALVDLLACLGAVAVVESTATKPGRDVAALE